MSISVTKIVSFRKSRGWSQEKLAAMSGLSERTIQRVEKDGSGSLDTKMALATAFDVSPAELNEKVEKPAESGSVKIDWGGRAFSPRFGRSTYHLADGNQWDMGIGKRRCCHWSDGYPIDYHSRCSKNLSTL